MKAKHAAQKLQSMGTGGDTILAHINPQEAAMLKAAGGSGKRNPKTGLLSYSFGDGIQADPGDPNSGGGNYGGSGGGNVGNSLFDLDPFNFSVGGKLDFLGLSPRDLAGIAFGPVGYGIAGLFSGLPGGNQFAGPSVNEHGGDSPGGGAYVPSAPGNATPGGLLGATTTTPPAPIYGRPAFTPKFGRPRGLLSTGGQLRGFLGG